MGFLKEFKAFALKGNVMDMAVGVIIGGAFGKIVTSLVNDIIMPPIGLLIGGVDFTNLKLVIKKAVGHWLNTRRCGCFLLSKIKDKGRLSDVQFVVRVCQIWGIVKRSSDG